MKSRKSVGRKIHNIKEWIVSYLVVLVIPIVICSAFFLYTYLMTWEEIRDSNTAVLQLVASELDQVFNETFLLEYQVQNNQKVKESAQAGLPLNAARRFLLIDAAKNVQTYLGNSAWIESWYVYYPLNDMALTAGGAYVSRAEVYERFGKGTGYSDKEWKELLRTKNYGVFLVNSNTGSIGYLSSLPLRKNTVSMNMLLVMDSGYIQRKLSSLDDMKNSGIVLLDDKNRILASRNLEDIDIERLSSKICAGEGYQTVMVDGEKMMVSCIESQRVGMKTVSVIPYWEFWKRAIQSLASFLAVLSLCILTGTGVAYVFSLRKKNTWGKFQGIVEGKLEEDADRWHYSSKEIAAAIDHIVQEYDAMQKQLTSVDSMKKELLISAALNGRIRAEDVEHVFESNKVAYHPDNYAVMLFKMNGFDHFLDKDEAECEPRDIGWVRQTVVSIVQKLQEKGFACEILNLDEKIVCLVDFGTLEKEICYEQIACLAGLEKDFEAERLAGFQAISVSDVHENVFSLHDAYSEASRVMEYQLVKGGELVMSYQEMVKKTQMSYLYSLENETALLHWIYEGKKEAALQLLDEIFEKNVGNANDSLKLCRCLVWDLTASLLRAENELKNRICLPDMQNLLEHVESMNTLHESKEILAQRIAQICEEVTSSRGKKGDIVAQQIKEYIREHATEPNLSNQEIAEHFHMNISYLSTFFKDMTGMSPLAYIHKVRLDNAKELLLNTVLTVETISEKVGLSNSVALTRLFKKYEGTTPAVYRKRNRR